MHVAFLDTIIEPTWFDPDLTIVLVREFFYWPTEKQESL